MPTPTQSSVLVTAGASGIGHAIATAFSAAGVGVHVADIDADAIEKLNAAHPDIHTSVADVADEAAVEGVFARHRNNGKLRRHRRTHRTFGGNRIGRLAAVRGGQFGRHFSMLPQSHPANARRRQGLHHQHRIHRRLARISAANALRFRQVGRAIQSRG